MRLFVAAWPTEEVTAVLAALPRPSIGSVRWTTPEQWHVTLVFLGEVDADQVPAAAAALEVAAARAAAPPLATLGPATVRVGRSLLWVPVDGLDELATATAAELGAAGVARRADPEDDHPFRGHVTLARARARARGRGAVPAALAGTPVAAGWRVGSLCLVRSSLDPDRARYETIAEATVPS